MPDDMMLSPDGRSLRRGRRAATRHPTERAAEMWRVGDEENAYAAICTDISTDGAGLQTRGQFEVDDEIMVDIKRGKEIGGVTFIYLRGRVVRVHQVGPGRFSVGITITSLERKRARTPSPADEPSDE